MRVMELHAPIRVVQRSKGRSATAAAAYRAAERIEDERTGQVHDYSRKRGVERTHVLTPEDAPAWAKNRERLWNAAEAREKHPRAQTARELEVGFPHEFSQAQRHEAGLKIGQLFVSRYGSAADIAWHSPSREGDQRNHHAHVLFTTRAIGVDGWAPTKRSVLDDRRIFTDEHGNKTSRGQEEVSSLRAAVAGVLNEIAARDRVQVYVEHQSFEARGLDREATQHMGPDATEMERRGEESAIGQENRARQARNSQREALEQEYDNVIDFAGYKEKFRARQAREQYYIDAQTRRVKLAEELEANYGQQEREARARYEQLQQERQQRNMFMRAWAFLSGRSRQEEAQLAEWQQGLHWIETRRREAHEAFDREQSQRLEKLKANIAADERARQDYMAQLEAQQESADAMRRDSEREAEFERLGEEGDEPDEPAARAVGDYESLEARYLEARADVFERSRQPDTHNSSADTAQPQGSSAAPQQTYEASEESYLRGVQGAPGAEAPDAGSEGPE